MTLKNCLVTGASRGIGRAIALGLAARGANVAVNYHTHEADAAETARLVDECGVRSLIIQADVADPEAAAGMVKRVARDFGSIDVLVNNAGIAKDYPVAGMEPDEWDRVIGVNLTGIFNTSRVAAKYMVHQKMGRIINISSVMAQLGGRGAANYAASKGGVEAFTRALALELAPKGVTVNAIAPGVIATGMIDHVMSQAGEKVLSMIPLGRAGRTEEVAALAAFLCSEEAGYITGQVIRIDGGFGLCG